MAHKAIHRHFVPRGGLDLRKPSPLSAHSGVRRPHGRIPELKQQRPACSGRSSWISQGRSEAEGDLSWGQEQGRVISFLGSPPAAGSLAPAWRAGGWQRAASRTLCAEATSWPPAPTNQSLGSARRLISNSR